MLCIRGVVSLSWNHTPNASTWIRAIASATWDQMDMAMRHRLTGDCATVDANIEASNGLILAKISRGSPTQIERSFIEAP